MSEHPIFTQKHYEYMVSAIKKRGGIPPRFLKVLCDIFYEDNPKFKPRVFRKSCKEGENE